jgi:hypothetical protein
VCVCVLVCVLCGCVYVCVCCVCVCVYEEFYSHASIRLHGLLLRQLHFFACLKVTLFLRGNNARTDAIWSVLHCPHAHAPAIVMTGDARGFLSAWQQYSRINSRKSPA